jgi:hypothetical protein
MRRRALRHQIDRDVATKLRRSISSRVRRSQARRQASRTLLTCQVYYTGINVQGEGVIRDISLLGCQVDGSVSVRPGTHLSLVLALPNSPVVVDRTVVAWSDGNRFGLRHELLLPTERRRFERLLNAKSQLLSHPAASLSTQSANFRSLPVGTPPRKREYEI